MILRVFRWSPEATRGRFQEFRIAPGEHTTVLDALVEVREREAPDLAFRYACRVGMCGSCAMVVDGRERWACRTRLAVVARANATVTVRPLYHFPLIRDLAVDMRPFVDKMRAVGGAFVARDAELSSTQPSGMARIPANSTARAAIDAAIECIGCGACVSACTMVRWDREFPGPAALNRAFTLVADRRDADVATRWDALFGEHGVWRCHAQAQCTAVCPMELDPTDSILRLRRRAARSLFLRV